MIEDLGRQVWADRASHSSRHYGREFNTEREEALWDSMYRYLINDIGTAIASKDVQDILGYMQDPRYNDVFVPYMGSQPLFRGMVISPEMVDDLLGSNKPDSVSRGSSSRALSDPIPVNFMYTPDKFYRQGVVSSWSTNGKVAVDYAREAGGVESKAKGNDWVGAVFITDASGGNFMDVSPLYSYRGLGANAHEAEIMGLGPIQVTAMRVQPAWIPRGRYDKPSW